MFENKIPSKGNATCYARAQIHNEAVICGDAGFIRFLEPFHCGETIQVQKFKDHGSNAQEVLPLGKRYPVPFHVQGLARSRAGSGLKNRDSRVSGQV